MNAQSISDFYGQDHDRLDELFQRFSALKFTNPSQSVGVFAEFRSGLELHIRWEEEILFPGFEEKTGMHGVGPTEVMRIEHRQIKTHLREIETKLQRNEFATDADEAQLQAVLASHNAKEEQILYPAIDQMLAAAEHAEVFARMKSGPIQLDVRDIPPARRHPLIFQTFEALGEGGAFVLINDHDPKPLSYQFAAEYAGQFSWEYLEQGPTVWRVRISRALAGCVAEGI